MIKHLFVYGSLMSAFGHPCGGRLAREASRLGPGTIDARLYAVSWYPGAVRTDARGEQVHGEVYALNSPAASLRWLDAYEGINTDPAFKGEFVRVSRAVHVPDGVDLTAWVYLYRYGVAGLRQIRRGRWQGR